MEADRAGPVTVFGSQIQPVEWNAAGRSSAVVPVLILNPYERSGFGTVYVNGREIAFDPQALDDSAPDPPELAAFWKQVDPQAGAGEAVESGTYAVARLWEPGQSWVTRRWTLIAVVIVVLALGVARYADPTRATRWMVVVAGGLCVGIVGLFPTQPTRRVVPAEGRPGWENIWYSARAGQTVVEPWMPGLRYVSESASDVIMRTPTLLCDAAGRPTAIRVQPTGLDRAFWHNRLVFARPVLQPITSPPVWSSPPPSGE